MGLLKAKKYCSVRWCDTISKTLGMCNTHYEQIRIHGSVRKTKYTKRHAVYKGDHILIPLGLNAKDGYTIIDVDCSWIIEYKLWLDRLGYVRLWKDGKTVLLHRIIMGNNKSEIDHEDNDKLNNRKSNLRYCTRSQNTTNRPVNKNSQTGYKCVTHIKKNNTYQAVVRSMGKTYRSKTFKTPEGAALAYNRIAKKLHGEFAYLNVVQ